MTVEAGLLKIGAAIANMGGRMLLGERRRKATIKSSLVELVGARGLGLIPQRRLERQLDQLAESISERMSDFVLSQFPGLPENERIAALQAVGETLKGADLADLSLMKVNVSARELRAMLDEPADQILAKTHLSEPAEGYFEVVLEESVAYLTEVVVSLPSFQGRALRELLERDSTIIDFLREILDRMPQRNDSGTRRATDVEVDYLREVARKLDQVEIFGVTTACPTRRLPLSVAYIDLTATSDAQRTASAFGSMEDSTTQASGEHGVEEVLSRKSRILIKGEAGSGKTTLLRWLAVNSARSSFRGILHHWNGLIPFFVQLRRYSDKPMPDPENLNAGVGWQVLADRPRGWMSSILRSGKGLVLIDGVDELPDRRRTDVMDWVSDLVATYPQCKYVVTSRSAAVSDAWLNRIRLKDDSYLDLESYVSFIHAELQPMTSTHIRLFIRHWHEAAGLDGNDEDREQLDALRGRLVAAIDANRALQGLATNPLLCALLCALNQDRRSQLPRRRIDLYQTALEMLLTRRDSDREIRDPVAEALTTEDKMHVLADVAFWFTENNFVSADRERVLGQMERSLQTFVGRSFDPKRVYKYLLLRSGVLREPAEGKVDFLHKSFQEFLCARKIVDSDLIEMLFDRARRRPFHETIVMAVGLARPHEQDELIAGLLEEIAEVSSRDVRTELQLLLVRCLETATRISSDVYFSALEEIKEIVPPRSIEEARALAMSGTDALRFLPTENLRTSEAVACIRTAALIGGPEAFGYIAEIAQRYPISAIGDELVSVWPFFDPVEFGEQVFRDAPTSNSTLVVTEPTILPGVASSPFSSVVCEFNEIARLEDLEDAIRLPALIGIRLSGCSRVTDLDWLGDSDLLTEFSAERCVNIQDIAPLNALPNLSRLSLVDLAPEIDLTPLIGNGALRVLEIGPVGQDVAAQLLAGLAKLETLELLGCLGLKRVDDLGGHRTLRKLVLEDCRTVSSVGDLRGFSRLNELQIHECPQLQSLREIALGEQTTSLALHWCDSLENIQDLASLSNLQELSLVGLQSLIDLEPLAALKSLRRVRISECPKLRDLSPLTTLPRLTLVDTYGLNSKLSLELAARMPKLRITERSPSAEFLIEFPDN